MAFVNAHHGVVLFGEVADFIQLRNGAVHGKSAVGENEAAAGGLGCLQFFLQIGHVVVFVAKALRFAQTNAVNNRGVVEFVGNDGVLFRQQRFEQAAIGIECCRVENGVFHAEKFRNFGFQFFVNVLCAADEPHRRQTKAVRIYGRFGGFNNRRMRRKPEVVVGTKI